MVAVRSRYSLGMLPVRSWYGILKVRSCLVFSTRLEPGTRTVRFIVRIAQLRLSWIRFGHRYYSFNTERIRCLAYCEKTIIASTVQLIAMLRAQSNSSFDSVWPIE